MSTIKPSSFDVTKLSISDARKLDNGSSQAYLNYNGKRLRVQAPCLPVPMDANDYNGNNKFKVQVSFRDSATNAAVAAYKKMIEDIDSFIVDTATENAGKWFGKRGEKRDVVASWYNPCIKVSKDKEGNPKNYPPTQSLALRQQTNKAGVTAFDAQIYDKNNKLLENSTPVEVLRRGCEISTINEITGIWIVGGKFGTTWKLFQARVDVPGEGGATSGFLGMDEADAPVVARSGAGGVSNAEEDDILSAVMPTSKPAAAAAVDEDEDEGEDEDEDESEVVKPVPVPAAKKVVADPVKKVVTVKKTVAVKKTA